MEEILASIRRIISEDEEDPTARPAPAAAPTRPAAVERTAAPVPEYQPPAPPSAQDDGADEHLATEDVEMIKKNVAEAFEDDVESIVDETTAAAASQAFRSLSATVKVSDTPGRSLEDIVTEMLRPMIKDWLDANLPAIVEEKVEEEVQRVARRRR
jgi:cell pole-organizing protein PopZ